MTWTTSTTGSARRSGKRSSGPSGSRSERSSTRAGRGASDSIVDVPDMDKFQEVMASDVAAEAMSFDGVHADTLVMLVES